MNDKDSKQQTGYSGTVNDISSSGQGDGKNYVFRSADTLEFDGKENQEATEKHEEITAEDEAKFYKKVFETKAL